MRTAPAHETCARLGLEPFPFGGVGRAPFAEVASRREGTAA
jgi:hypothetical protein